MEISEKVIENFPEIFEKSMEDSGKFPRNLWKIPGNFRDLSGMIYTYGKIPDVGDGRSPQ